MDADRLGANLEQFRDPTYRQLHWIEDPLLIQDITKSYIAPKKRFGLEVGFGEEPTRVNLMNPEIDWLLTEPSPDDFSHARRNIYHYWEGVQTDVLPANQKIISLMAPATREMIRAASVLLYRNPTTRDMGFIVPPRGNLQQGQRIVLIINNTHIGELEHYRGFLLRNGYDPDNLILREKLLPPLTSELPPPSDETWIFDLQT